jgi:hypothetical protein
MYHYVQIKTQKETVNSFDTTGTVFRGEKHLYVWTLSTAWDIIIGVYKIF